MSDKHEEKYFEDLEEELSNEEKFLRSFESTKSPSKILFEIYKGNYGKILKSSFFYLLKYIPCIIKPIIVAYIIDLAVDALKIGGMPDIKRILILFGLLALTLALNIPFNYLHTENYSKAIRSVEAGLRSSMVRKLQHLSINYHREMQSGRVQSKIMRDVENIETMSTTLFTTAIGVVCSLVSAVAVTASKSWIVLCMFAVIVPLSIILCRSFKSSIGRRNKEFRSEVEKASASVAEMVELIPVTKAHALEDTESDIIGERLKEVAKKGYALDMLQSFFGSISWVFFQVFQLLSLGVTIFLAVKHYISIGDITLYETYFSSIFSNVSTIINLIPIIAKGFESVRSVGDILSAYDVEDNNGKHQFKEFKGEYDFTDMRFGFDTDNGYISVINGLNLHVNPGETIALVGESGSGKSTILNLVIGFYKSKEGKLTIDGIDINDIDLHSYRTHIAVVPQSTVLFSGTIRENITFGNPDVSEGELWRAIKAANLEKMISEMPYGLNTQVGEHGDKLSGGQKQRISIARAIIRKPDVIIFDEATSALDTVSEKLIQEAIDNLCRDKTTFIVAHRLSTIRNADKIAVIDKGRCVEYGTYEDLMAKQGEFYKFKTLQS